MLREPELIYKVDRELGREEMERFSEKDFMNTDYQILVTYIKESLDQNEEEPRDYIVSHLPENLLDIVAELLETTKNLDPTAEKVLEDLLRAFLNLRKWQLGRNRDHLRFLQETSHENGDFKASEYHNRTLLYSQEELKIDKLKERFTNRNATL